MHSDKTEKMSLKMSLEHVVFPESKDLTVNDRYVSKGHRC